MKNKVVLFLKGFCMGIAEIIPGVSGGTIAFLLGIYEEFISALKSVNVMFAKHVLACQWKKALGVLSWKFLLTLGLGMAAAIFTLSHLLEYLLKHHSEYIYGFFFGLILATGPIIAKVIKVWTPLRFVSMLVSFYITFKIVMLVPLEAGHSYLTLFFSGAVAISAMILPGISGSFILLILGQYHYVLSAVNDRNILVLSVFLLGVTAGIVTFVRVVSWLLKKYHDTTLTILTGIVLGSLNRIWPWKKDLKFMVDRHGELVPIDQMNIWPVWDGSVLGVLVCVSVGFSLAVWINQSEGRIVTSERAA